MTDDLVRPTIPIAYVVDIARRCPSRAISRALAASSISSHALRAPRVRISIAQYLRFHTVLSRDIDDEMFGYFARPVPRGAFATMLRMLTGSPDIRAMLVSAGRFYRLFDRHDHLHVAIARDRATLTLHPRETAQARSVFFVHSMLLAAWRTATWLAAQAIPLDELSLPPRFRRFRSETRYLFGREPSFGGGPPRLAFRAELASLPSVRRPEEADTYVKTSLRDLLLAPPRPSLHDALRAVLAAATPFADLSVDEAARRLARSRATLARQLAQLGTSFQQVKDELRRDHAIALLADSTLGLAAIADRLGYSAASAFQRAFRDWTGVAPGALRRAR